MTTYSQLYTGPGGKSNARRAARKAGVSLDLVKAHGEGFRFPMPETDKPAPVAFTETTSSSHSAALKDLMAGHTLAAAVAEGKATEAAARGMVAKAAAPSPFKAQFRFDTYAAARGAADEAARRARVSAATYLVATEPSPRGPKYAIVPDHRAGEFVIVTQDAAKPEAAERAQAEPKAKRAKAAKASKTRGAAGAKKALVLNMITADKGATMPELQKATGYLPHTLRARIAELAAANKLEVSRERLLGVTTYTAKPKA